MFPLIVDSSSVVKSDSLNPSEFDLSEATAPYIPVLSDAEYKTQVIKHFAQCVNGKPKINQVPTYYNYSSSRDCSIPRGDTTFPGSTAFPFSFRLLRV